MGGQDDSRRDAGNDDHPHFEDGEFEADEFEALTPPFVEVEAATAPAERSTRPIPIPHFPPRRT